MNRKNWLGLLPLALVVVTGVVVGMVADAWGPFKHTVSPVMVDLGIVQVRYYGLVYMLGFILMFVMLRRAAKRGEVNLKGDDLEALVLLMIAGVVLGARLFEILIYNPGYYFSDPLAMVKVWEGGLSFPSGSSRGRPGGRECWS